MFVGNPKLIALATAAIALCLLAGNPAAQPVKSGAPELSTVSGFAFGGEGIEFTKNAGQWPDSILFRADAGGAVMWVVKDGIYYQFTRRIPKPTSGEEALAAGMGPRQIDPGGHDGELRDSTEMTMVKAQFVASNPNVEVAGLDELEHKCNYFLGNDESKWRTDVPNYAAISLREIYPGVTATFRGKDGTLEYQLEGSPEALQKVKTEYSGAPVSAVDDEVTVMNTSLGPKKFEGILPVSESAGTTTMQESVISPSAMSLVYSTYLGGSSSDLGDAIAVDGSGRAYVTGSTFSTNFPTLTPYQTEPGDGNLDVFVTKLSATGNTLIYSTYLGGGAADQAYDLTVDGSGNAYVTGYTTSTNFPTLTPYQTDQAGQDVFVTKLSAAGNSLAYSTYLGG